MTWSPPRPPRFAPLALTALLLGGCVAGTVPATRYYVLNPVLASAPVEGARDRPLTVDLGSLRLPQYLQRPQIVTRSGEHRLELAEFHQWGGNLRKDMMRVLAKNLARLLDTPNVAMAPHLASAAADFRIDLEVMRFERDFDGRVRLSVQWRLARGNERRPLMSRISDLESEVVPAGPDLAPTVAAMSALFGELSRLIAREILDHGAGPQA